MPAGPHVELVAVPGTNDVERIVDIVDPEAAALLVEPFFDPLHQATLAHRPALVRAIVAPGIKCAIDVEDADLGTVDIDDLTLPVGNVRLARHENLFDARRLNLVDHRASLVGVIRRRRSTYPPFRG